MNHTNIIQLETELSKYTEKTSDYKKFKDFIRTKHHTNQTNKRILPTRISIEK